MIELKNILVPTDFSEFGEQAPALWLRISQTIRLKTTPAECRSGCRRDVP